MPKELPLPSPRDQLFPLPACEIMSHHFWRSLMSVRNRLEAGCSVHSVSERAGVRYVGLMIVAAVFLLSGARSHAQAPAPDRLDIQTWNVAVGQHVYLTQHGARAPDHLGFGLGLALQYQRNPFVIHNVEPDGSRGDLRTAVVKDLAVGEIYGFLGLYKRLTLGLSMPLALYQSGSTVTDTGEIAPGGDLSTFGWGDVALHAKAHLHTFQSAGLSFAALLSVTAPTGQFSESFQGEESVTFRPRLVAEYVHRYMSVAVNLGAIIRVKEVEFFEGNFKQGQQFTYGLGLAATPSRKVPLTILGELFGRTDFVNRVDRNPMEAGLALDYRLPRGVHLMLGGGAGVLAGLGAPDFRVFFGIKWVPSMVDSDGDGIPDERDRCPSHPGPASTRGCPLDMVDDDNDGIPNHLDKCPDEAEDFDGFQDSDGCPDLDNDGDGVPDKEDQCPMNAGPASSKGCPDHMLDDDGDGIPNNLDKCPNEPEDRDGFQDSDGCPDPDNDGDGIPDTHDECPNDAEDFDGFQDSDGCPDPDNDGDGVCDDNPTIQQNLEKYKSVCIGADKCPDKPETINAYKDTDGCPDTATPLVTLSAKGGEGYMGRFLAPAVKTWFIGETTQLTPLAKRALDQLAMMLRIKQYRPLRKIVIMGFTEPDMPAARAKQLSQGWANEARRYLVDQGISAERLGAVGAAGTNPLCKARTARCRAQNRRLEIFITRIQQ